MKYIVVDNTEWTYPDLDFASYPTGALELQADTPRNTSVGFQVLLREVPEDAAPAIALEGVDGEVLELVPVYVEGNPGLTPENALPHFPERWGPYWIYDCVRTRGERLHPKDGVAGLYVLVRIPAGAAVGRLEGTLRVGELSIPIRLQVHRAVVPDETQLKFINGYNRRCVAQFHHLDPESPAFDAMDTAYLTMLRRMHQNMLYAPAAAVTELGDNRYAFDFAPLEAFISKTWNLGFRYYNLGGIGGRRSWKESTILVHGMPAMGYEAYRYMAQYLPALQDFLERHGWLEHCYLGIADEPNEANATEFRALAGIVRKLAPRIKLQDAMSYGPIHGALDVWIPLNSEYQEHREQIETFREGGDEIWHYVCCGPRLHGYINRFMDIPLLATRYLFWGNYAYDLKGYLHWAANSYQPGQDPFLQNNPEHHNADSMTILPPGDTHLIYPGEDGPWMSLRLEAQRESAEDYELLTMLARKDRAAADALCAQCFTSFNQVEYDPNRFKAVRTQLLEALD